MPERKVWTPQQDRVLKFLVEERGITRWADIPKIMQQQFEIMGRNGKQCRERYHNHLAQNINNTEWSKQEENLLFQLQNQLGNKWALISNQILGRTDNHVKNHFYSKLRKGLRKINKKILKYMKREFKEIKTTVLYRIIETIQNKNKGSAQKQGQIYDLCKRIKDKLREYEQEEFENLSEEMKNVREIIDDFILFDPEIKRPPRKKNTKNYEKLFESDCLKKTQTYLACSTNSKNEESESFSNYSDLYSSDQLSLSASRSNGSIKPKVNLNISRSAQEMESEHESESDQNEKPFLLYKSENALKPPTLTKSSHHHPRVQPQTHQKQPSVISDKSANSDDSINDKQMYMFGEESLEMRVVMPKDLTIEEKMQISQEQDEMFEMKLEEQLVNDFSGLGMGNIPKLRQHIDWQ